MSAENRDSLDNTTVDDPEFAVNCNVNVDDFEIERTIVRQRQTAIYNQIVNDAANRNSSSGSTTDSPAVAAAAAAPVESASPAAAAAPPVEPPPPPPAAAAAAPREGNCPPQHVHILNRVGFQPPDLLQVITNHLQNLEFHHLDPALARAAARAAVMVIVAARTDPDARAAIDRAEAEYQALLAKVGALAAELPAVPAAAAAVAPEPPAAAAAAAAAAPEPSEPPAKAKAKAKATGAKRKRPTEEAKGQHKQKRRNKTVRIEEEVSEIESESEYELRYDSDFEEPFRVKKTK